MNNEKTNDYGKLLKDARWQKKRLEVMQRDNFTCQDCGKGLNDGIVLNVHHIRYRKGLLPWEYKDYELVTLCEDCHGNTHKKKEIPKKENKIIYKENFVPFYRNLFSRRELKPCDKIVISYLIMLEHFDDLDGTKSNQASIAMTLCMSRHTVFSIIHRLQSLGICDERKRVLIKDDLTTGGYFELVARDKLSGENLIFYSYLINKSERYDYCIDTYEYKLAKEFCTTRNAIKNHLKRLYDLGYAERLKDGRLKINLTPQQND